MYELFAKSGCCQNHCLGKSELGKPQKKKKLVDQGWVRYAEDAAAAARSLWK